MLFDPVKTRFNGFSEAMLKWQLEAQYDPKRPMGKAGTFCVRIDISNSMRAVGNGVKYPLVVPSQTQSNPKRTLD